MTEYINTDINEAGVATVQLNRPERHNAFDDHIIASLTECFNHLNTHSAVRVMILSAAGKSFSAGGDLAWMQRMVNYSYQENVDDAKALARMLHTLNTFSKPTVARVHGPAYGGAVGLVSCCDIAIGTPHAAFSLSEVKVGLIPATISPYVIAAIGERASRRFCLTGERFGAEQAQQLGLLSEVLDEEQLDTRINEITNQLIANSPSAISSTKSLIQAVKHKTVNEQLIQQTSEEIARVRASPEGQEGLAAFFEKRQANWNLGNRP